MWTIFLFRFKVYAPIAFRHFRDLFRIAPDDYMISLCNEPLTELSNPGASGSIFYLTNDDEFIIKTVQHKEAEFLQKLLPGYYMVCKYIYIQLHFLYSLYIIIIYILYYTRVSTNLENSGKLMKTQGKLWVFVLCLISSEISVFLWPKIVYIVL